VGNESEQKPDPPDAWDGEFILHYPDGHQSHFIQRGVMHRVGDRYDSTPYKIERFEVLDEKVEGKWMLCAVLVRIEDEEADRS
jgi:hypothetical protein